MKNIYVLISVFFLSFAFQSDAYAFGMSFPAKYIPVDSLTPNDCRHYVGLDLKDGKINLILDNREMIFEQTVFNLDTVKIFRDYRLFYKLGNGDFYTLQINELKYINSDSIYISAVLQKFNGKNVNVGGAKDKNLAIAKSELSGVVISVPTVKAIKKKQRVFAVVIGGITTMITFLSLLLSN